MSVFASPLLLTDEEILNMGIKPHDVEVFRRRQYQFSFGIHTWYPALAPHTFFTSSFELSFNEAKAITACHHHRASEGTFLTDIKKKLEDKLKLFPNGAFIKLDTRSPKDVPVYAFQNEGVRKLIDAELGKLDKNALQDDDETTAAFVRATNKYMKVTTAEEALNLLSASDRVSQDLDRALEYGETHFTSKVVLREWIDEVPEHPEMEFRGFVHKNQLNALTQYFSFVRFPNLVGNKSKVVARIINFFESVKDLITHESYVIDFFVHESRVIIIELNPFHNGAGAGLFSWKTDRQLFMEGPFQFRITDTPAAERVPTDVLPLFWHKYIQEKRKQLLDKNGYQHMIPILLLATYGFWRVSSALLKNS